MEHLGFELSRANPDVWFMLAERKDSTEYYEHMLLYMDDCLIIPDRGRTS